jgi:hypothetical protein
MCRAHYPGGPDRCICRSLPHRRGLPRLVGGSAYTIWLFEACSGFTRVTAHWIAQPPKAAFVTGLRRSRLPDHVARQLPDQSTTISTEPSSFDTPRLRGSLPASLSDDSFISRNSLDSFAPSPVKAIKGGGGRNSRELGSTKKSADRLVGITGRDRIRVRNMRSLLDVGWVKHFALTQHPREVSTQSCCASHGIDAKMILPFAVNDHALDLRHGIIDRGGESLAFRHASAHQS